MNSTGRSLPSNPMKSRLSSSWPSKASAEEPPSQADLVALWGLTEKDVEAAPPIVRITINREDEEAPAAK